MSHWWLSFVCHAYPQCPSSYISLSLPLRHLGPPRPFLCGWKFPPSGEIQRHNKWRDCWRMCQRWKEVYLDTVTARSYVSDVQNVSGPNLRPCKWIRPCRSSGFVVVLEEKVGTFDKCFLDSTVLDRGQYLIPSLCVYEQIKPSGLQHGSYIIS